MNKILATIAIICFAAVLTQADEPMGYVGLEVNPVFTAFMGTRIYKGQMSFGGEIRQEIPEAFDGPALSETRIFATFPFSERKEFRVDLQFGSVIENGHIDNLPDRTYTQIAFRTYREE